LGLSRLGDRTMRHILVALAMVLWAGRAAFAEGAGVEKPPKPGVKPAAEAKPAGDNEAEKMIKETLKTKKVTFEFVEVSIGDAMDFMRRLINVNMILAPDVDRAATLTLKANDMPVGEALQWMAKLVNAKMEVKDGAVMIQRAGEGDAEFPPKAKAKQDAERLRRVGLAPGSIGKAVIPLGNGASVELNLGEGDIDPGLRRVLLELLHKRIAAKLRQERGAADLEDVPGPAKPDAPGEKDKTQF
jgi:hypothetical protein